MLLKIHVEVRTVHGRYMPQLAPIVKLVRIHAHGLADAQLIWVELETGHLLLHEDLLFQVVCLPFHLWGLVVQGWRVLVAGSTAPANTVVFKSFYE